MPTIGSTHSHRVRAAVRPCPGGQGADRVAVPRASTREPIRSPAGSGPRRRPAGRRRTPDPARSTRGPVRWPRAGRPPATTERATVTATAASTVSCRLMWTSSWASTPSSSTRVSDRSSAEVTTRVAAPGSRPTDMALGTGLSTTAMAGWGRPMVAHRPSTRLCSRGRSASSTGSAPTARSTAPGARRQSATSTASSHHHECRSRRVHGHSDRRQERRRRQPPITSPGTRHIRTARRWLARMARASSLPSLPRSTRRRRRGRGHRRRPGGPDLAVPDPGRRPPEDDGRPAARRAPTLSPAAAGTAPATPGPAGAGAARSLPASATAAGAARRPRPVAVAIPVAAPAGRSPAPVAGRRPPPAGRVPDPEPFPGPVEPPGRPPRTVRPALFGGHPWSEQCTAAQAPGRTTAARYRGLVPLGQAVHRPVGGPGRRRRPASPARWTAHGARRLVERPGPSARRPGHAGVTRGHQHGVAAGRLAVAVDVAGHHQRSGRPWPRAGPSRRTHRPSDGAQTTSAATSRRIFSSSASTPEPVRGRPTRGAAGAGRRSRGRRRPPRASAAGRRRHRLTASGVEGLEQDARPLRSSWRPRNSTVGRSARPRVDVDEPVDLDAVEPDVVGAAEGAAGPWPRAASRRAQRTARRPASRRVSGSERVVEGTAARCGGRWPPAAGRSPPMQQPVGDARGERLVDVDHVEGSPCGRAGSARTHGRNRDASPGPPSRCRAGRPSVQWPPGRSPSGASAAASSGANTVTRWPRRPSARARPDHLALHAARAGEAVGADEGDAAGPGRRQSGPGGSTGRSVRHADRRSRRRLHLTPYMASSARLSSLEGSVSGLSTKTPPTEASTVSVRPSIR